jgi:hypothetical protein
MRCELEPGWFGFTPMSLMSIFKPRRFDCTALALAIVASFAAARPAAAGGGPENVLLVVNASSESSKTIANHYIELRKIPTQNVVYLDWKGSLGKCKGSNFRQRILAPAIQAMEDRKLTPQIDYIVYSSDFPWAVDLQSLFPGEVFPKQFAPTASLTGATYLTPFVMGKNPAIVAPNINWYVPGPIEPNQWKCQQLGNVPSRGFRARYLWDASGKRTNDAKAGQRYLLSTMLGVTSGRGNSVEEVLFYLSRAVKADGTRPGGTIYFMANQGKRSRPRDQCYAAVATQIQALGVRAVALQGGLPRGASDVMGLMAGLAGFDWSATGNTILPGAICEHLTSLGGVLTADAAHTPLTEFLRHGAAGASGTVREPLDIQAKFPLPSLHLHYARGCSLAEAFYQSVSGPYQLLIVGDPLCQPWATFPNIAVEGVKPGQEVRGSLAITASSTGTGGQAILSYDLVIDGRLVARSLPGKTLTVDTTKLSDGYHELRLVGVQVGPIETQGRQVVPITIQNRDTKLEWTVSPLKTSPTGKVQVSVRQPGAVGFAIRQNSREVGRVQGEAGNVEISAATLGRGPTTLQAFSEGDAPMVSAPVRIQVD